jgi:hypothetical protein
LAELKQKPDQLAKWKCGVLSHGEHHKAKDRKMGGEAADKLPFPGLFLQYSIKVVF